MTETGGDYLGCMIVLIGLAPLLRAVGLAGRGKLYVARRLTIVSIALSLIGVAVVILT